MSSVPNFENTRGLMRRLGLVEIETRYDWRAFGSWYVTAFVQGKSVRVSWDGRDQWLVIEELVGPKDWRDRWIAGANRDNKPEELESALRSVLGG